MSIYCIVWRDIYGEIRTTTEYHSNFAAARRSAEDMVRRLDGIIIKIEHVGVKY